MFLVKIIEVIKWFQGDTNRIERYHIVSAIDAVEAESKVRAFYAAKHEDFLIDYEVELIDITEAIA